MAKPKRDKPTETMAHVESLDVKLPSEVLAERVREFREHRGWSLRELSRRLDAIDHRLDASSLLKIEDGSRKVGVDEWLHLAVVLGVPPLELLIDDPNRWLDIVGMEAPMDGGLVRNWILGMDFLLNDEDHPAYVPAEFFERLALRDAWLSSWVLHAARLSWEAALQNMRRVRRLRDPEAEKQAEELVMRTHARYERVYEEWSAYKDVAERLDEIGDNGSDDEEG